MRRPSTGVAGRAMCCEGGICELFPDNTARFEVSPESNVLPSPAPVFASSLRGRLAAGAEEVLANLN